MTDYELERHEINTPKCGRISVFSHGSKVNHETALLTVHDLGCNYTQYVNFLKHPSMEQFLKRFLWIHVQLPGQGDMEEDLSLEYKFPSLQDIADDLVHVIEPLGVKNVVLFGEGAGANILARFAINHDQRVLGAILVHVVGGTDSFFTKANRRISITSKLPTQGMNTAAEEFLIKHRFGSVKEKSHQELKHGVEEYKASLNSSINARNLNLYITAYNNRNSIKERIADIRCPVLFITGNRSPNKTEVVDLHYALQRAFDSEPVRRNKVELVQMDGVANVLVEKPEKVAEYIQFFLQGLGLGGSLMTRRMSQAGTGATASANAAAFFASSRSVSMEEHDQPRGKVFYSPERKTSLVAESGFEAVNNNGNSAINGSRGDVAM